MTTKHHPAAWAALVVARVHLIEGNEATPCACRSGPCSADCHAYGEPAAWAVYHADALGREHHIADCRSRTLALDMAATIARETIEAPANDSRHVHRLRPGRPRRCSCQRHFLRSLCDHREETSTEPESAHTLDACIYHYPGRVWAWVEFIGPNFSSRTTGCPEWAANIMREGHVTR